MRVLKLGAAEFPLVSKPPKGGAVLVLSKKLTSTNQRAQMAAFYDLISMMVENADGLDDALAQMDLDEIDEAIGEAMQSYTGLPTVRPSPSAPGSPPTATTSKVVSLSRGTVRTESQTA